MIERGIEAVELETLGEADKIALFKLVAYYQLTLNELDKRFAMAEVQKF